MWKDVIIWIILVIVLLVAIGQFRLPFLNRSQVANSQRVQGDIDIFGDETLTEPARESGVTVTELVREPLVYEGLNITLTGKIEDWVTKRAFTIRAVNGTQTAEVLVINPSDFPNPEVVTDTDLALGDNTLVRSTGSVRILTEDQIAAMLGVDFDDKLLSKFNFNREPVLVATESVELN